MLQYLTTYSMINNMRTCTLCKIDQPIDSYAKKTSYYDGISPWCRSCTSKRAKLDYERVKEKRKAQASAYYINNKEEILKDRKENREVYLEKAKNWRIKNRDKVREYSKSYRAERSLRDPLYRIKKRLTGRLREVLHKNGWKKYTSATGSIGCDAETLKAHIENQFIDGMSWDNYGKWQVDHVTPMASAQTEQDVYLLNHYKNLKPLWAADNYQKWDKLGYYSNTENEFLKFFTDLSLEFTTHIFNTKDIEITFSAINVKILYKDVNTNCEYNKNIKPIDHLNLTRKHEKNGFKVIQIVSYEWENSPNNVKSFLRSALGKNSVTIYARNTEIRKVGKIETSLFLEKYHILGSVTHKEAIGLYYNNELVSLVTIGKHHRGIDELVLNRYVGKEDITVVGGLSKLTKYIVQNYGKVSTWVDLRISNGTNWEKCGWTKISQLPPDYLYYDRLRDKIVGKQSRRKVVVNTPIGMTEHEHALKDGLYRIYDCGKIKLIAK